jgi:hypothetical protein
VCAVFVLLTAYAFLDEFSNLVFYIWELVVLLDEFYCSRNTRVSMKWVIVVTAYDFFL